MATMVASCIHTMSKATMKRAARVAMRVVEATAMAMMRTVLGDLQ